MAIFVTTAERVSLLADCIRIGLEGASQNHVDTGGENSDDDLQAIAAILEELDGLAEVGGDVELTIVSLGRHLLQDATGEELDLERCKAEYGDARLDTVDVSIETDEDLGEAALEMQRKGSW